MKRAKWHLGERVRGGATRWQWSDVFVCLYLPGIRSQSKPHDIMYEVYRAMKTLTFVSIQHPASGRLDY